jgi:NmrA-like family
VEEYIASLGIPFTSVHLGVFFNYLLMWLKADPSSTSTSKSYKLSLPLTPDLKLPMISVNTDTGKYVKAILLNREKVLGKQISAAGGHYSPEDIVRVLKEVGGLDVTVERITEAEQRQHMAALGAPEFFIDDIVDNVKFMQEYGFFSEKVAEEGREVSLFIDFRNCGYGLFC